MNSRSAPLHQTCSLCGSQKATWFFTDERGGGSPRFWPYFHCQECDLIFRDPATRLEPVDERAQYCTHNNDVSDPGYLRFLQPTYDAVCGNFEVGSRGMDFGCGPGPALSHRLSEAGYEMEKYDPFFFPNEDVLKNSFEFITCTEVFEHFFEPGKELEKLLRMLEPGGALIVRTQFHEGRSAFPKWYYRNDPTHVCFFSRATFEWMARRHELGLDVPSVHHAILRRL